MKEIFPLLNFNPETNRYIAMNAKKSPNGSDLNQPINPLEKIGIETEKISAANSPAVVPPKTRTKANTTIAVREPITNGKSTVKSYTDEPKLNTGYNDAAVKWSVTWDVSDTFRPNGCQLFSSIQLK